MIMDKPMKKIAAYVLVGLVLVFTVVSILGIWEVINFDYVVRKILLSLVVIFAASAVILFILTILGKDNEVEQKPQ